MSTWSNRPHALATMPKNKEQKMSESTMSQNINALTGVDVSTKTPAQILALMVKKSELATSATIQLCVLGYVLIIENSYKVKEACDRLDLGESTVRAYSEKGRILAMAADATNADKMYAQLGALDMDTIRKMSADLLNSKDRAGHVQKVSVRTQVAKRLGKNATPEAIDALTDALIELGAVTPNQIRKQIADVATAMQVTLPPVTRETNSTEEAAAKVPTAAGALATLEKFEQDREQGSEGLGFAITEEEATALIEAAKTAIRTLRRAGRHGAIAEIGMFLDESVEMIEA